MPEDTMQSTQLADMEMRLERSLTTNLTASLTTSLTTSISTNLQSIIDKSLNDALEKMTSKMSELIVSDPTIKKQQSDVNFLKYENSRLAKQVSALEMEQDKLKHKLNQVEQRSLDHCLVMKGIHEMAKENKKDCIELVYNALANTIEAEDEDDRKQAARKMEIRRARRIGRFNENYDRPISIEFSFKHDADYIMENRSYLESGIYVDCEYTSDIEYRRKLLQPILRAARNHDDYRGRCRMDRDKLVILGRNYGLHNLTQLPEDLKPFNVTSKETDDCIGFFGALNLLSNFYPVKFTIGNETYISTEQYIQAQKAEYFKDKQSYDKIMCATNSLDCKNFARGIKNFNRRTWETVAKDICRAGIQAKFMQNPDLLQILVEKTTSKKIVESANDRLWGTGVPLAREGCLNKEMWITPGILGELLMEIRENQTMFPLSIPVKSYPPPHAAEKTLIGITNMPLLGVTPNNTPITTDIRSPTTMPPTVKSVPLTTLPTNTTSSVVEVTVFQPGDVGDTGETKIPSDHPSMVPEPTNTETPCNSSAKENTSVMEIS